MKTITAPTNIPASVARAPGAALCNLLAAFRREAQDRGNYGRDFVLGCLDLVAGNWRTLIRRCGAEAGVVVDELGIADATFDQIAADGIITPREINAYKHTLAQPRQRAKRVAATLNESCADECAPLAARE